jgi:hypothetical protein
MDVNARIDRLSGSEAKAALKWTVEQIARNDQRYAAVDIDLDVTQKIVLGDALLKSRK